MKRTMVLTILGLVTALSFSAHARRIPGAVAYVTLQCNRVSGIYPAFQLNVQGAVSQTGNVVPTEDDPNGYRIEFMLRDPSWTGRVNMRAFRNFGGSYYYSDFSCTGDI